MPPNWNGRRFFSADRTVGVEGVALVKDGSDEPVEIRS